MQVEVLPDSVLLHQKSGNSKHIFKFGGFTVYPKKTSGVLFINPHELQIRAQIDQWSPLVNDESDAVELLEKVTTYEAPNIEVSCRQCGNCFINQER